MDIDYAWLAGLLEGEGSFFKGSRRSPGKPVVSITMTDRDVVQRAADLLGVLSFHERIPANPKWKPVYRMQVSGQRAVDLMNRIRPMMGERRRGQIDVALACWNPIWERNRERNAEILRRHAAGEGPTQIGNGVGMRRQAVRAVIVRASEGGRHAC